MMDNIRYLKLKDGLSAMLKQNLAVRLAYRSLKVMLSKREIGFVGDLFSNAMS
jgi:hypothetical protein